MQAPHALRDGWRRGRHYGMDGEGEDITHYGMDGEGKDFTRLMGVWGQRPQQAEAVL